MQIHTAAVRVERPALSLSRLRFTNLSFLPSIVDTVDTRPFLSSHAAWVRGYAVLCFTDNATTLGGVCCV